MEMPNLWIYGLFSSLSFQENHFMKGRSGGGFITLHTAASLTERKSKLQYLEHLLLLLLLLSLQKSKKPIATAAGVGATFIFFP